jgi:hypothetical protein
MILNEKQKNVEDFRRQRKFLSVSQEQALDWRQAERTELVAVIGWLIHNSSSEFLPKFSRNVSGKPKDWRLIFK